VEIATKAPASCADSNMDDFVLGSIGYYSMDLPVIIRRIDSYPLIASNAFAAKSSQNGFMVVDAISESETLETSIHQL